MIIGKRPTNDTFNNNVDIHLFTTMALPQNALGIIDPLVLFEERHEEENEYIHVKAIKSGNDDRELVPRWMEECLVSIMKIWLACSMKVPRERASSINVVVNELQAIKNSYLEFKKTHCRFHKYLLPQA
ncbi:unnamed protein product [Citrullus colocynthis]|uniref:Uncharacterized protein n=1 Tax=Citrullus colocynthis TaxID=252529 RepID=A0ABP0YS48_9ROSI